MKILYSLFLSVTACMLCACTDTEQFRVNGEIKGNPTMNLRIVYYANGALQTSVTAVRDGKFEFFCNSPQPTLVEICDNEYRPLARLYASNGETFQLNIDRTKPYNIQIDGNDVSQRWASFLNSNAESLALGGIAANKVISSYIGTHPTDVLSTLLLVTAYNASTSAHEADSLLSLIAAEARPSSLTDGYSLILQRLVTSDSIPPVGPIKYIDDKNERKVLDIKAKPYSLLVFNNSESRKISKPTLEKIHAIKADNKPEIADFLVTARDLTIRRDTVPWVVGEIPGGLSAPQIDSLSVPHMPYFILCDSAGRQLMRTEVPEDISRFVDSLLTTH